MKPMTKTAVFLERASYRQRRLRDAARLLPVLGAVLWAIPLLWAPVEPGSSNSVDALLYTFGVWVALIALTAMISRKLQDDDPAATGDASD